MNRAFLSHLLSIIVDRGRRLRNRASPIASSPRPENLAVLCIDLLSRRGEASGTSIAGEILDRYAELDASGRLAFFEILATQFGPDRQRLEQAVAAWQKRSADDADLHFASEPRRQELLRRLNRAPEGTTALVRMREQLLAHLPSRPELGPVDRDFTHLLSSWFNRGFLVLKRIDWTTPINILDRIIHHEAVHAIENWDDLRNRLKPADRRCFAFFHPQLADEPLIFVEVALVIEIPTSIAALLDHDRQPLSDRVATAAVFYSISNTQKGLAGISFGNFLIKQVVADLHSELPYLSQFVTLSPVPGFARWLQQERSNENSKWVSGTARGTLAHLDDPDWYLDQTRRAIVRPSLLQAAACYLLKAKAATGRPLDPVARFHLGNGARLERLNFLGDTSPRALEQAHGIMVNYCYALDDIESNHEAFVERGIVAASEEIHAALHGRNNIVNTSEL